MTMNDRHTRGVRLPVVELLLLSDAVFVTQLIYKVGHLRYILGPRS